MFHFILSCSSSINHINVLFIKSSLMLVVGYIECTLILFYLQVKKKIVGDLHGQRRQRVKPQHQVHQAKNM